MFRLQSIFFGGIEPALRKEVWPFLLHYYPYESTYEQRDQIKNDKYLEYQKIRKKRFVYFYGYIGNELRNFISDMLVYSCLETIGKSVNPLDNVINHLVQLYAT